MLRKTMIPIGLFILGLAMVVGTIIVSLGAYRYGASLGLVSLIFPAIRLLLGSVAMLWSLAKLVGSRRT